MLPSLFHDNQYTKPTDDRPRYFVDDNFDAGTDCDWWLDLGRVDVPPLPDR